MSASSSGAKGELEQMRTLSTGSLSTTIEEELPWGFAATEEGKAARKQQVLLMGQDTEAFTEQLRKADRAKTKEGAPKCREEEEGEDKKDEAVGAPKGQEEEGGEDKEDKEDVGEEEGRDGNEKEEDEDGNQDKGEEGDELAFCGINIQSPWAEHILFGEKVEETRTYRMPSCVQPGVPMWVIQTDSKWGSAKRAAMKIKGLRNVKKPLGKARIIGTVTFSDEYKYETVEEWAAAAPRHCVNPDGPAAWMGRPTDPTDRPTDRPDRPSDRPDRQTDRTDHRLRDKPHTVT